MCLARLHIQTEELVILPDLGRVRNVTPVRRNGDPLCSQHGLGRKKFRCLAPVCGSDPQGLLAARRIANDNQESLAIWEPIPAEYTGIVDRQLKTHEATGIRVENP